MAIIRREAVRPVQRDKAMPALIRLVPRIERRVVVVVLERRRQTGTARQVSPRRLLVARSLVAAAVAEVKIQTAPVLAALAAVELERPAEPQPQEPPTRAAVAVEPQRMEPRAGLADRAS